MNNLFIVVIAFAGITNGLIREWKRMTPENIWPVTGSATIVNPNKVTVTNGAGALIYPDALQTNLIQSIRISFDASVADINSGFGFSILISESIMFADNAFDPNDYFGTKLGAFGTPGMIAMIALTQKPGGVCGTGKYNCVVNKLATVMATRPVDSCVLSNSPTRIVVDITSSAPYQSITTISTITLSVNGSQLFSTTVNIALPPKFRIAITGSTSNTYELNSVWIFITHPHYDFDPEPYPWATHGDAYLMSSSEYQLTSSANSEGLVSYVGTTYSTGNTVALVFQAKYSGANPGFGLGISVTGNKFQSSDDPTLYPGNSLGAIGNPNLYILAALTSGPIGICDDNTTNYGCLTSTNPSISTNDNRLLNPLLTTSYQSFYFQMDKNCTVTLSDASFVEVMHAQFASCHS